MTRQHIATRSVVSHRCSLSYTVEGRTDGPTLLFSNALGTTMDMWAEQIDALGRQFRVVRYDTRGHGQSDAPAGEYTLDQLGRDALAVLDAVGVERAHMCGLSLGGLTAMWLGVHATQRIDSLVLACTASRIGSVDLWNARIEQVRTAGLSSLADSMMARWFSEEFRSTRPDRVAELRDALAGTSQDGYAGCCAALRDADLADRIDAIAAPVLVISGASDPATPPADGKALQARIPGAAFVLLDAAHLANIERSALFNEALMQFLGQRTAVWNEVP